jgi:hypothetical protein
MSPANPEVAAAIAFALEIGNYKAAVLLNATTVSAGHDSTPRRVD